MKRLPWIVALVAFPSVAQAYTLGTSVSEPCHERMTLEALRQTSPPPIVAPEDSTWPALAAHMSQTLDRLPEANPADAARFLATVLGVRAPDLLDVAPTDLAGLRHVHLPDERQADHFLRRSDHDHAAGNDQAVADAQIRLRELIELSAAAYDADPDGSLLRPIQVWVEGYGVVEVRVWEPLFIAAQALHLVQDSFSHTYRTDDARRILSVHNYVDPILSADYELQRDGPAHTTVFDGCVDLETAPLRAAAVSASVHLLEVTYAYWLNRDPALIDALNSSWMSLEPDCSNCSSRWVTVAARREALTQGGCSLSPGRGTPRDALWLLLAALAMGVRAVGFRRRHSSP